MFIFIVFYIHYKISPVKTKTLSLLFLLSRQNPLAMPAPHHSRLSKCLLVNRGPKKAWAVLAKATYLLLGVFPTSNLSAWDIGFINCQIVVMLWK